MRTIRGYWSVEGKEHTMKIAAGIPRSFREPIIAPDNRSTAFASSDSAGEVFILDDDNLTCYLNV